MTQQTAKQTTQRLTEGERLDEAKRRKRAREEEKFERERQSATVPPWKRAIVELARHASEDLKALTMEALHAHELRRKELMKELRKVRGDLAKIRYRAKV